MTCCNKHKSILCRENNTNADNRYKKKFVKWFGDLISCTNNMLFLIIIKIIIWTNIFFMLWCRWNISISIKEEGTIDELYDLVCGLERKVNYYASCIIGEMRFHTKELEMQYKGAWDATTDPE